MTLLIQVQKAIDVLTHPVNADALFASLFLKAEILPLVPNPYLTQRLDWFAQNHDAVEQHSNVLALQTEREVIKREFRFRGINPEALDPTP